MAEIEPIPIDEAVQIKPIIGNPGQVKKQLKRKRVDPFLLSSTLEEKHAKIVAFRSEISSLIKLYKDLVVESRGELMANVDKVGKPLNSVVACLMEESDLPLSKLVDEIFEKAKSVNEIADGVSRASVKSTVLIVGQRLCYGVISADADVLEDESEFALWCWETRDLKLMPVLLRASLKVRRTCRKKIQERIAAVSVMINALEKSEDRPSCVQDLMKASERLHRVLNEADIRLLVENMTHKSGSKITENEAKREEKLLIMQMERSKKEKEKERKRMDRELEKEKLQSEKELRRLHSEAQKEERRRDNEEYKFHRQLKRQQEEAEKEQRRKEKEEAESRKCLVLQKQASLMDRFLKRNKTNSLSPKDNPINITITSGLPPNTPGKMSGSVSLSMDSILARNDGAEVEGIWSSHLNSWRCMGRLIQSNKKMHWGIRHKPKRELVKELKLSTNKELCYDGDLNDEKLEVGCVSSNVDRTLSHMNIDDNHIPFGWNCNRARKLLQFDKSFRPAFYGVWPKESQVVSGRHPFRKDLDIDYEIDSDEEWEEDEPGESLSDCDKDDEEQSMDEHVKDDDDEDGSEDDFFVPDGYLSENEGVNSDDMNSDDLIEDLKNSSNSVQQIRSEELCIFLRQQKYLSNITEHALKKNQPLIILNLMHDKTTLLSAEELTGIDKLERMCLQALSICSFPGLPELDISITSDVVDEGNEDFCDKSVTTPVTNASILESDLPQIISIIQKCPNSIDKICTSLKNKFPSVSKSHLKNKVREISEFSDNRWQVKKEILIKHGLSTSPEKRCLKTKTIASFLKRCLPPSGITKNLCETSPPSSQKHPPTAERQKDAACVNNY